MSTIAYAAITSARESAPAGRSTSTAKPGMATYVDALAALVPAEVLTLHGLIMSYAAKPLEKLATGATAAAAASAAEPVATTTIPATAGTTLTVSFWMLAAGAGLLYLFSKKASGKWQSWDWLRTLIAPIAFVAWTMLQPTTAFDAAFPAVPALARTVTALFIAFFLTALTTWLAGKADAMPSTEHAH